MARAVEGEPRHAGTTGEVSRHFLRLGLTAFGGPAAHIALFRDEFVRRRGWLDDRDFLDLLSAANLIPGPTSTELAMHIGYRRAGWSGLLAAGLSFLLPATLVVLGLAWAYERYGALPAAGALLAGIAPVVVAIVAHATALLGRTALAGTWAALVAVGAAVAAWIGVPAVAVLLVAGAVGVARSGVRGAPFASLGAAISIGLVPAVGGAVGWTGLVGLAVIFARVGLLLFGSGYLLVTLLDAELVATGVLTRRELLDAVAVGQVTPGPVITTATFIGYALHGLPGAIVATGAITLPAFVSVGASVPVLARLRSSKTARAALDGVAAAVVGMLAVTASQLGAAAIVDAPTALLAAAAFAALLSGVNPVWLIAVGAVVGVGSAALGA